jgi:peptidoglycan/LPS O-acetylase OafA/YrhL
VYFIDWLRVLAVLLLFPFHSGRVFNYGELFYAKSAIESVPLSYLLGFIDYWHMPLLFLLAGASTYFAMKKRTIGRYLGERSLRLGVPLFFGVLVLVPPQTWCGAQTNAGYTGSFLEYLTSGAAFSTENLLGRGDYYGGISPAHLWFIWFLWMISVAVVPLLAIGRSERGGAVLDRIARAWSKPLWWPLVVFLILFAEALPAIADKNIFYFAMFFTLGYLLIRGDWFVGSAERHRWWTLAAGTVTVVLTMAFWRFGEALPDPSPQLALWTYVELGGAWLIIVGLVGFGKRFLDRPSPSLTYLGEASYPVYILHQTVIVLTGFYLVRVVPWPAIGWPLLMVLAVAITFALYEVVRRVGALRFLFGMRPKRPTSEQSPAAS